MDRSPESRLNILQTPFCGDLRSKKFYMYDTIFTTAEEYNDSSGHIWCYYTQMPIGPDGVAVTAETCGPGRRCYRSAVSKPPSYLVMQNFKKDPEVEV